MQSVGNFMNSAGTLVQRLTTLLVVGYSGYTYYQYTQSPPMGETIKNTITTASSAIDPDKIAKATAKVITEVSQASSKEFIRAYEEVNRTIVRESAKTWLPLMFAVGIVGTGLPLAYQYIQKVLLHNIGKPPLALKQRKVTRLGSLMEKITRAKPPVLPQPIFKKEVHDQIQDIVKAVNNIQKNQAYFQNVILYGPGGTGKTMVAEKIAIEAGMNYIMMSGGELGQFIKRGEHVAELNKLLNAAEKSSKPTIIFIDEAEGLCKKRGDLDQERLELQNTLLNRTGTPSKKVMLILATNRVEDIDSAILNRMTYKMHIDVPGLEERAQILDMYVKQFFTDAAEREAFFNPAAIQELAKRTDKLSGRSLFYLINMIFAKKGSTEDNRVTKQIIDRSLHEFVQQEEKLSRQLG